MRRRRTRQKTRDSGRERERERDRETETETEGGGERDRGGISREMNELLPQIRHGTRRHDDGFSPSFLARSLPAFYPQIKWAFVLGGVACIALIRRVLSY